MAHPKRRHSQSRRDMRRSQQRLHPATLSSCPQCGMARVSHRVCPTCGFYRGREVIARRADDKKTDKGQ